MPGLEDEILHKEYVPGRITPFVMGVHTDADELGTGTVASTNEIDVFPGGIIGFSLDFAQNVSC